MQLLIFVRYMYIPFGGRKFRGASVWIIFLFVAIWHDIEPKLIAWGTLNGLFYLVEVLISIS
jgi:D-alanyl-lipoteichoic acid acyltransferase DltB (MBOAT superfamily)